jgi:hypothetical protein
MGQACIWSFWAGCPEMLSTLTERPESLLRGGLPACLFSLQDRLEIVPEDSAQSVGTILLHGVAGRESREQIFRHSPEVAIAWVRGILGANDTYALAHTDIQW